MISKMLLLEYGKGLKVSSTNSVESIEEGKNVFYQNRALDLIESSKVKDAWNKDLMNINQLMTFDRAVMTYNIVNQLCPAGLQNKFIERSVISKYNTRNRKDLHVQKLTLEYTKRGFLYTCPIAWNNIPQPIRDTDSIVRFKKTKISPFELREISSARIYGRSGNIF